MVYGINTIGLRFFTVYGPWGRPDMAPMIFTDAILNDKEIKIFNNGNMSRDFTYIDDVVNGIIQILYNTIKQNKKFNVNNPDPAISSAPYQLYNIGNSTPLSLMHFIETIEKSLEKKSKKRFMAMQDADMVSTYADINMSINDFGYKPSTTLQKGIDKFIKWYKEFYKI